LIYNNFLKRMGKIVIGRSPECDIVVDDPEKIVSRVHAELICEGSRYLYRDTSANGTYIDGQRLCKNQKIITHGTPVLLAGKILMPWDKVDALMKSCSSDYIADPVKKESAVVGENEKDSITAILNMLFIGKDRINRSTYWTYGMFVFSFLMLCAFLVSYIKPYFDASVLLLIILAVAAYALLQLNVKRCHDRDKSGWFILVSFIPFISLWYDIEVCFLRGTYGRNHYGEEPAYDPYIKIPMIIASVMFITVLCYMMYEAVSSPAILLFLGYLLNL